MYDNIFNDMAYTVINKLYKVKIRCRIKKHNRYGNSIYLQLGRTNDDYNVLRLSNHQGRLTSKYTIRNDIKESKKIIKNGRTHFIYAIKDFKGMLLKIKKDITLTS